MRLLLRLKGVDVGRVGRKRPVDAVLAGMFQQLLQQVMRPAGPRRCDHGRKGLHPFPRFLRILVRRKAVCISPSRSKA